MHLRLKNTFGRAKHFHFVCSLAWYFHKYYQHPTNNTNKKKEQVEGETMSEVVEEVGIVLLTSNIGEMVVYCTTQQC